MFKSLKIFLVSLFLIPLFILTGCTKDMIAFPGRIAEIQKKIDTDLQKFGTDLNDSANKLLSDYENKTKTQYLEKLQASLEQRNKELEKNGITNAIFSKSFPPETANKNDISLSTVSNQPGPNLLNKSEKTSINDLTNLSGNWNYNNLGQKIIINVELQNNDLLNASAFFNGYNFQLSAKVSEFTNDGLVIKGDYNGEPTVIKLKLVPDEKLSFTVVEAGKNISSLLIGVPLILERK